MKQKLDDYEKELEANIDQYSSVNEEKKEFIEGIIDGENVKKSISLRLKSNDLELFKQRADDEGLPYQTLLSSLVHKFVSDELVSIRSIWKRMEILKAS